MGGQRLGLRSNGDDQACLAAVEHARSGLVLIAVLDGSLVAVARCMGMDAKLRHGGNGGVMVNGVPARARMRQWLQKEGAESEQQERR